MLVDDIYYQASYRAGTTPLISDSEFAFYERPAEREVDRHTGGQISAAVLLDPAYEASDTIKDCICEVAEYLCKRDQAYRADQGGVITSYSNDGQSASFDNSGLTDTAAPAKIRSIIKSYLSGTDLLNRGVDMWHG